MIDFKSLCSKSTAYQHGEDKFGEEWKYDRNRSGETTGQLFSTPT
jgi:hypothetical protein